MPNSFPSPPSESRSLLVRLIYRFPKGTIWQTRYLCLPAVLILSTYHFSKVECPIWTPLFFFLTGAALWTLLEYLFHRFILHYSATSEAGRALVDRLHVFHHHDPKDQTQVCIPPVLLLVFGLALFGGFTLIPGLAPAAPLFITLGLMSLMVIYDIAHFSTHYMPATHPILVVLKKHHMLHHFQDSTRRFGVTSPFWDWVFKTLN